MPPEAVAVFFHQNGYAPIPGPSPNYGGREQEEKQRRHVIVRLLCEKFPPP